MREGIARSPFHFQNDPTRGVDQRPVCHVGDRLFLIAEEETFTFGRTAKAKGRISADVSFDRETLKAELAQKAAASGNH